EDYSYIMQCHNIKPRYKILKELLDNIKHCQNGFIKSGEEKKIIGYKARLSTNINHFEVLPDKSAEMGQSKIQSSTSSCAIKKSVSSIDNTSKRKADLEKLMKDTEKLAPILPSLSQ
ncbi:5381_t:CDS:2, partial [Cetraspora pellucida]